MPTQTGIATDKMIQVPKGTYPLLYSPRLVRTGADFYGTLKASAEMAVTAGNCLSLPTDMEEHQVYVQKSPGLKKLWDADEFKDYFAKDNGGWHAWALSLTGLRFREKDLGKPYNLGDKVTAEVIITDIIPYISQIADKKFIRENWKDIIEEVNKVKGDITMPYSRGHVVRAVHPVFGIFTEIEPTTEHNAPYALHAWLRNNLDIQKDPISCYYDVAVGRWSDWHRGEDWCLDVDACYERSVADPDSGFRPVVRGSLKEIEKDSVLIIPENAEQEFLERMRKDYREMPFPDFQRKYEL
jgi:hypothetical protein